MSKRSIILSLLVIAIPVLIFAQTFSGKCVGVTDGDTIRVMKDGKEVKIRLDGIDCPETGQDFGSKAKKFTSSLVFGKDVQVVQKDIDKYGRTVARIIVDGKDLSLELVKAGLAWHYKQYSNDPELANAEVVARQNEEGLWAQNNPTAPWDWRHGTTTTTPTTASTQASPQSTTEDQNGTVYVTNTGKKYHSAGCRYLKSSIPMSLKDAIAAGYSPCSVCGGRASASTPTQPNQTVQSAQPNGSDPAIGTTATGKTIYQGPRGGQYHISKSGNKVYEKKKK